MKVAIMQPYFLPYVGYFQLIRSVDLFILYDDVDYSKGGWVNRNQLLHQGRPLLFTVPLANGKPGVKIHQLKLAASFPAWRERFLRTVQQSYAKARNLPVIFPLLQSWLQDEGEWLAKINCRSLRELAAWFGIKTEIIDSSSVYGNQSLRGADRLIDICRKVGASIYVNAAGGRELYHPKHFHRAGIELRFLEPDLRSYPQLANEFVPRMSILDLAMNVGKMEVALYLQGTTVPASDSAPQEDYE